VAETTSLSLAPALLLSMPQLMDENFHRTVVLLCKHSEEAGAFGLVVNRPLVTTGRVVVNVQSAASGETAPDKTLSTDRDLEVWIGGPVEPQRSWILVGAQAEHEDEVGMRIAEGLYLSTSPALLKRLLDPDPPTNARLMVGYAGWGPGQLEAELQASSWLLSDVDRDLIFRTPPDRMWEAAIRRLGADPAALQMSRGVH
jgi:putative transcriptional regulator